VNTKCKMLLEKSVFWHFDDNMTVFSYLRARFATTFCFHNNCLGVLTPTVILYYAVFLTTALLTSV